jgi:hypothetical protein
VTERLDAFADTNLFLAYATDFENYHDYAVAFFESKKFAKHSGMSVRMELNKVKTRRNQLYTDLADTLNNGMPSSAIQPSVTLNHKNDLTHLKALLKEIDKMGKDEQLIYLRRLFRIIDIGTKHALDLLKTLAPISTDFVLKREMETCVPNTSDAAIIVDALCWAENDDDLNAVFCTTDGTDILRNRPSIYRTIRRSRMCTQDEIAIEIKGLLEILHIS